MYTCREQVPEGISPDCSYVLVKEEVRFQSGTASTVTRSKVQSCRVKVMVGVEKMKQL